MIPRFSTRSLLIATVLVAVLLALYLWFRQGVTVSIHNSGSMDIKDVVVHVTGQSYKIGDVSAGATKSCRVNPRGESDVKICYSLSDGSKRHHTIDCYIEPGYRRSILTEVKNGELIQESQWKAK